MTPTREQLSEVVRRALVEDAGMPVEWFPAEGSHVAEAVVNAVMALLPAQPEPKVILRGHVVGCGPWGDGSGVDLTVVGEIADPDVEIRVGLNDGTRVVVTVADAGERTR